MTGSNFSFFRSISHHAGSAPMTGSPGWFIDRSTVPRGSPCNRVPYVPKVMWQATGRESTRPIFARDASAGKRVAGRAPRRSRNPNTSNCYSHRGESRTVPVRFAPKV